MREYQPKDNLQYMARQNTTFRESHAAIFEEFNKGTKRIDIANMFGVTRQAVGDWHRTWLAILDFSDEPAIISDIKEMEIKKIMNRGMAGIITHTQKQSISRKITAIDDMRLRGLNIVNMAIDRIEVLIGGENDIKKLSSVLSALLPYVATRKEDSSGGADLPIEERRSMFIQNVMNIYNTQLTSKDDTTIEDCTEGNSEE